MNWNKKQNLLNAKDICDIVTACGASGVKNLKLGSLEISFQAVELPKPQPVSKPYIVQVEQEPTSSTPPQEDHSVLDQEDLYLTNPTQWEELGTRQN